MVDQELVDELQRRAVLGDAMTLTSEQLRAVLKELLQSAALRDREAQLVAALDAVEFGLVGANSTAPMCQSCGGARGMGHRRSCPVGGALAAVRQDRPLARLLAKDERQ